MAIPGTYNPAPVQGLPPGVTPGSIATGVPGAVPSGTVPGAAPAPGSMHPFWQHLLDLFKNGGADKGFSGFKRRPVSTTRWGHAWQGENKMARYPVHSPTAAAAPVVPAAGLQATSAVLGAPAAAVPADPFKSAFFDTLNSLGRS